MKNQYKLFSNNAATDTISKTQPTTRSVRAEEFAYLLGVSIATLYKMEKQGKLPARRRINQKVRRWSLHDVNMFLESKLGSEAT